MVTGGAGFIGSHLVHHLVHSGWQVIVLDSMENGDLDNLREVRGAIEILTEDICDPRMLQGSMANLDVVFHLAAVPSVQLSIDDPLANRPVNYHGAYNVLKAAVDQGVPRFVFASSAAVYGDTKKVPIREDDPYDPRSPYAFHKLLVEGYLHSAKAEHGIHTASLRFFNVYGPRQRPDSPYSGVISIFADCLRQGNQPRIFGDGYQTRDFVFVDDVVQALMLAANEPRANGQVLNVGTGKGISLNFLLDTLGELVGLIPEPVYEPERHGDIRHSVADISKLTSLGYKPRFDLRSGLKELLDWLG